MSSSNRIRMVVLVAAIALVALACDWRPVVDPPPGGGAVTTETMRLGPFVLGPGEDIETTMAAPRPEGDFGIVGMRFRVTDEHGTTLGAMDGIHLHHLVMLDTDARDTVCPDRAERFGGTGMEYTPIDIPEPYAYLVDADDDWAALFHLMDVRGGHGGHGAGVTTQATMTEDRTLFIEYDIDLQRGATPDTVRPVTPLYLDVAGCGSSEFAVPGTGSPAEHVERATFTAPADGIAVFTLSHFHAGGIHQRLIGQTETWCDAVGEYGQMGHLESIPPCALHHQVEKGVRYVVESVYDNSEPIPDAMGVQFTYVWWGTQ